MGAGLIISGLLWALTRTREDSLRIYRTPLDLPMAAYGAAGILFYVSSENPATAASEFQRMIFSLGAYFVAVQACSGWESERKRRWVLAGWAGGTLLSSIYGILQKSGGISNIRVPQLDRVFSTFGNPIFLAAFLILSIPALAGAYLEEKRFWPKAGFLAALLAALWALFYTGTRAAFLALPAALLLFYALLEIPSGWARTKKIWANKGKVLAALAVIALIGLKSEGVRRAVHASRMTATSQTHTLIWKDVLNMWRAHPWAGTGFGTFHVQFREYQSAELKAAFPESERIINDAHNEYLQILAETGLAGFLVFAWILVSFFRSSMRRALQPGESGNGLLAGLIAGAAALLLENFFSVDMRFIVSSAYVFLAFGLAASFFSREVRWKWPEKGAGILKPAWAALFVLASGVPGLFSKSLDFGLLPELLRPYKANRELKADPDFFQQKYPETVPDLEELAQKTPQDWLVWDKLGFAYAKLIETQDASGRKVHPEMAERSVTAYLKAHELNPAAFAPPNNIGNIYYTMRRPAEAIGWWKKAVAINPERADARLNLGIAYYNLGRIKESSEQLEEVLKRDPKNKTALVLLKKMVE